jgi:hypothetical protein
MEDSSLEWQNEFDFLSAYQPTDGLNRQHGDSMGLFCRTGGAVREWMEECQLMQAVYARLHNARACCKGCDIDTALTRLPAGPSACDAALQAQRSLFTGTVCHRYKGTTFMFCSQSF